jgi:hypothetical protein
MGKNIAGLSSVSFVATAKMGGLWNNLFLSTAKSISMQDGSS